MSPGLALPSNPTGGVKHPRVLQRQSDRRVTSVFSELREREAPRPSMVRNTPLKRAEGGTLDGQERVQVSGRVHQRATRRRAGQTPTRTEDDSEGVARC